MTISLSGAGVRGVLLDIEGTTTPIGFVYDVLFRFARAHLREYLRANLHASDLKTTLGQLREEHETDVAAGAAPPSWIEEPANAGLASAAAYVEWLMDRDRKSPGLKTLQGRIWEGGYRAGALGGEVFEDVPRALERWRARGLDVRIYSSGSVLAQRLLFSTTKHGDLTRLLDGHFDTAVGPKGEPDSYARIATAMRLRPAEILFVSDVPRELDAARSAGLRTTLIARPGNAPVPPGHAHPIVQAFDEILD